MSRRVLILGATGLVGRELLDLLLRDDTVDRVSVITRRPTGKSHHRLDEHVFDLTEMEKHRSLFAVDQLFSALGSTIRQAGSQEEFRRIDYELPLTAARLAREHGAEHFLLVSALGANDKSRVFYNRVKGEIERDIIALDYPAVTIARPSLLLGDRTERRRGEDLAKPLGWLMPRRFKPIQASTVARALIEAAARPNARGTRILESREMRERFG